MLNHSIKYFSPSLVLCRRNFFSSLPKFDYNKDYYKSLQVSKDANENDIRKAYYKLAKIYHPDHNPNMESKFKEINEAYSVLSDHQAKKQYDTARIFSSQGRNNSQQQGQQWWNQNQNNSQWQHRQSQNHEWQNRQWQNSQQHNRYRYNPWQQSQKQKNQYQDPNQAYNRYREAAERLRQQKLRRMQQEWEAHYSRRQFREQMAQQYERQAFRSLLRRFFWFGFFIMFFSSILSSYSRRLYADQYGFQHSGSSSRYQYQDPITLAVSNQQGNSYYRI